jgi:outer membrane protein assembly factor BamE
MMMRKLLINTTVIASFILGGCATGTDDRITGVLPMDKIPGIYRIPIRQGNLVTQEMVNELKPGMTKQQVRYLLGTPLLIDTFNEDRWEYLYTNRPGSQTLRVETEKKRLALLFQQGRLFKISGDMYPQGEELAKITKEENRERTIVIPPEYPKDIEKIGIFERVLNKATGYEE